MMSLILVTWLVCFLDRGEAFSRTLPILALRRASNHIQIPKLVASPVLPLKFQLRANGTENLCLSAPGVCNTRINSEDQTLQREKDVAVRERDVAVREKDVAEREKAEWKKRTEVFIVLINNVTSSKLICFFV